MRLLDMFPGASGHNETNRPITDFETGSNLFVGRAYGVQTPDFPYVVFL